MEKIILFFLMIVISIAFGFVGKKITNFEKSIFKKLFYFPLFIFVLSLLSVIFIFINLNLAILFFSFGVIALTWYL